MRAACLALACLALAGCGDDEPRPAGAAAERAFAEALDDYCAAARDAYTDLRRELGAELEGVTAQDEATRRSIPFLEEFAERLRPPMTTFVEARAPARWADFEDEADASFTTTLDTLRRGLADAREGDLYSLLKTKRPDLHEPPEDLIARAPACRELGAIDETG